MGDPTTGTMSVRVTCEGRASRRWRGARNQVEAAALNQRLSEQRAKTVYDRVESIIKHELPNLPIALRQRALGSSSPLPTAGEDNAAVDRSVVVMVDLTTTVRTISTIKRPPKKIYAPSEFWELKIESLIGATGLGFRASYLRIKIRNPFTGQELSLSGPIFGGDLDIGPGMLGKVPKADPVKFDKPTDLLKQAHDGQEGNLVTFRTRRLMDFEDWINKKDGQDVRLVHSHIKTGVTKTQSSFLQFLNVDTYEGALVFDLKTLGFGLAIPNVEVVAQMGRLKPENHPLDYYLAPAPDDIVPSQIVSPGRDGILVSFPTGKFAWNDLSSDQREQLRKFVMNQVANIRVFTRYKDVVAPSL